MRRRFDAALVALGRLDAVTALLPNAALLLYSFVRKEAVLSSMIEGTQSSLADLMLFDPKTVARGPKRRAHDLPAGAARLTAGAIGLQGVWISRIAHFIKKNQQVLFLATY